jgi:predicted enzyme related to lactoylglutathione lyase
MENQETNVNPIAEMKLELVPVPVTDVDRAKTFYVEQVGFQADHDRTFDNGMRVVQLTPPGSACSIALGVGLGEISEVPPGIIKGLHLVVDDIAKTREALLGRGVEVAAIQDYGGILLARFSDPDGNSWLLQEIPARFR